MFFSVSQKVGSWYARELRKLGFEDASKEERIEPEHHLYKKVRDIGIEVDLRAQELMVLMARVVSQKNRLQGISLMKNSLMIHVSEMLISRT